LAALNGLPPDALLIIGEVLTLPVAIGSREGPPFPTPERVTSAQVEQIAAANGVPGFLAASVAWQESGFNNDLVSGANARGVMQILPGTWAWINATLTSGLPLAPASALANVRAGVLYLRALLDATGGDVRLAVAGYYQGLASVRANGMYADTARYVADVLALRPSFGGP
jgi:soluble lytic murein transglycosylase-like protein